MKKLSKYLLALSAPIVLSVAALTLILDTTAKSLPGSSMTASSSSALADGSAAITLSWEFFHYECSLDNTKTSTDSSYCPNNGYGESIKKPLPPGGTLPVVATGSGNTLSVSTIDGSQASGSFTIKSTVAGTKTVKILSFLVNGVEGGTLAHEDVTFTAPPTPTTTTTTTNRRTNTTATTQTTQEAARPEAPKTAAVMIADAPVDTSKPVSVAKDKPLVISGKTVPNATVTLYIYSEPKTATTTADAEGNWSYTITGLPEGSHHVEAEVTDPATSKTSERAKLLDFVVTAAAPAQAAVTSEPVKKSNKALLAGMVLLLTAMGGGWYWWSKKKGVKAPTDSPKLN